MALRSRVVAKLESYDGTRYVWGGEGFAGIDCSGLVRSSLINACVVEGVWSLDGELLRHAASLWWHDGSAIALRSEYRDQCRKLFETPAINELDLSRLKPGDFAVTTTGRHVLAYIGNNRWIGADPIAGEVIIIPVSPGGVRWLEVPLTILRWRVLNEG